MNRRAACEWPPDRDHGIPAPALRVRCTTPPDTLLRLFASSFQRHQIGGHIVNVAVGVGRKELAMWLVRIADLDAGTLAGSSERTFRSVRQPHDDIEVVEPDQRTLYL